MVGSSSGSAINVGVGAYGVVSQRYRRKVKIKRGNRDFAIGRGRDNTGGGGRDVGTVASGIESNRRTLKGTGEEINLTIQIDVHPDPCNHIEAARIGIRREAHAESNFPVRQVSTGPAIIKNGVEGGV